MEGKEVWGLAFILYMITTSAYCHMGWPPFGIMFAIDDPLAVGPDLTSEIIEKAHGLSYHRITSIGADFDFGLASGEFNWSSIVDTKRELGVGGGRIKFRLAKGFVQLKTCFIYRTTGYAIDDYSFKKKKQKKILTSLKSD
ncbi:DIRIGENT PROTEIN 4 [Salix koriyanagi]|uniref:Dirigent protein n=1 Tax=Salix koriyanagi TaxID=2511006 RepID=A0A9Q0WT44_9ROSI|nr:DIRIGENT PROTEIN 4 [Salix koriyanagi]